MSLPHAPRLRSVTPGEWLVLLMLVGCAIASTFVTPVYEAPDEPAHLAYVSHLLSARSLPPIPAPGAYDALNYEAHQPPLAYLVAASAVRLGGGREIGLDTRADPSFSFARSGSRMFLSAGAGVSPAGVRAARVAGALWLTLSLAAMFLALQLHVSDPFVRIAALAVVGGCPQYVWLSGVMNNDGALVAMSSWTILALMVVMKTGEKRWLAVAVVTACAATMAKGSGLFLAGGLLFAGILLLVRGQRSASLMAAVGAALPVMAFGLLNHVRTGSAFAPLPATEGAGWAALVASPEWPARVAYSFWAKFGWMNTPMHPLWYLWFGLISMVVVAGAVSMFRQRRFEALLPAALVAGNLAVLVVYLAQVDFQTQGRYLHPVLIVFVVFAGVALSAVRRRLVLQGMLAFGLLAPVAGIVTVWLAYG